MLKQAFEIRLRVGKWKNWNPCSQENLQSVKNICPIDDENPWYILGNSFGNRVICSLIETGLCSPTKVIMLGYPLYGNKGTPERVNLFKTVPTGTHILCISGSNDTFLTSGPQVSMIGSEIYQSIIDQSLCKETTILRIISTGGHGVVDGSEAKSTIACTTIVNWILDFIL